MSNGEIKNIAGVPVVVNPYLPKDTILVMGNHCRYCGERITEYQYVCFNSESPDGMHFPEFKFIKVNNGN